jgi:hypothetical protein
MLGKGFGTSGDLVGEFFVLGKRLDQLKNDGGICGGGEAEGGAIGGKF